MLELHGTPISNYHNKVKLALLEKNIPFKELKASPSQEEEYLKISPMGKIPYIRDNNHVIVESTVILEYLEAAYPDTPPLYPKDSFKAARCKEIITFVDWYIDEPARKLLGAAYFGREATDELLKTVDKNVTKGIKALSRLLNLSPFTQAQTFTAADITLITTLPLVQQILQKTLQKDPLTDLPNYENFLEAAYQRDTVQSVMLDNQKAMADFLETRK